MWGVYKGASKAIPRALIAKLKLQDIPYGSLYGLAKKKCILAGHYSQLDQLLHFFFFFLARARASYSSLSSSSLFLRYWISILKRLSCSSTFWRKSCSRLSSSALAAKSEIFLTVFYTASSSRAHSGVGNAGSFFLRFLGFFLSSFYLMGLPLASSGSSGGYSRSG